MNVSRRGGASLDAVHCSRCAATPILSSHDARCVYCSMPLQMPAEVLRRTHEPAHAQAIAEYREEAVRTAEKRRPDLPDFTKFIAFLQLVVVGGGTAWWYWLVNA